MSVKRPKKSVILELLAWFAVSVAVAVILVLLSERFLNPAF